ncbi:unnamed protein product [Cuscuta campestris]|uniref:Uncharacterized protein n=1 Tax=Cuscuta campestris TaxID=132261 RepID=A0A484JZ41_9ASTE|nr:unnamed protein product [Cuscuta campestris]
MINTRRDIAYVIICLRLDTVPVQYRYWRRYRFEFNQIFSGRGDANLPTLDSLFENVDEAGLDNLDRDDEPTPQSNDVDVEAGEPETSRGLDKVSGGYGGPEKHLRSRHPVE